MACSCCNDETLEESCACEAEHEEEEEESPLEIAKSIGLSFALLLCAMLVDHAFELPSWLQLLIYLPSYWIAAHEVLEEALESVLQGRPFDEDFLMAVATIGALLIAFIPGGKPEFAEAVFVMLFFRVGECFESLASDRSKKSISELMDIRPDVAHVIKEGKTLEVDPKTIAIGDKLLLSAGEKLAVDARVLEGTSSIDTLALTGESKPRDVSAGDTIYSGSINLSGSLVLEATNSFGESTASKILKLVQDASKNKSKSESLIRKFARIYTPAVVYVALALALLGPLFSGDYAAHFADWLLRALTFLIVSCPCALVVSVPLSFFSGIGAASRQGILVKGSNYLELLAQAKRVAFDKTGTLTKGNFSVSAVHPSDISQAELLHLAAHIEAHSSHPIAEALRAAYPDAASELDSCKVSDIQEKAGLGLVATVNGVQYALGNVRLMQDFAATLPHCPHPAGTVIHIAKEGCYLGHIVIEDEIKAESAAAIAELEKNNLKTYMFSGDRTEVAQKVAAELGISHWKAELLPQDKLEETDKLIQEAPEAKLIFVGDGINDAPVLARADLGIAMGALGSDVAIEAADIVLMDDNPQKISTAIRIAKNTLTIAHQNIALALIVKFGILILAAFGLAPMWLAVFGDTGVLILCILNATRAFKSK